jgi:hypothetical protein
MSVSLEDAKKAKKSLGDRFNFASSKNANINGIPLSGLAIGQEGDDYNVSVYVGRKLTAQEEAGMPQEEKGVSIKYIFVGPIRAL